MNGRQNEQPRPVTLQPFCGDVFNHPSMTAPVFFLNPMSIDRSQCNTSIPQLYNLPQHILPIQPLSFQQNFIYPSHIRHQYATQSFRGAMTPEMIQNLPRSIASSTAPTEPIVKRKPHPLPVINPSSGQEVRLRPPILPGKPLYHSEYRGNSSVLINTDVRRSNVPTSTSSSTAAADKEVANYTDLAAIPKNNTKPVVKKVFTRNLATEKEFTHEKKQKKSNPLLDKTEKKSLVQEDDSGDMLYCLIKKIRDGEHVVFTENIKHIDSTKKYVPKSGINIATSQELAQSSNVIDDDLPPEIRDLINPEMKITNAFDRSEPVQEEIQEWLPSEMQMSDDDDKIDEYLADINEISDELQNVDAKDSNVEDINKENTIVTETYVDPAISKQLSRSFIISCYANPATRLKPENMTSSSVVLNKPLDNLLDVLKKSMHAHENYGMGPMRNYISRNDMGRGSMNRYGSIEVQLHRAQQPYQIKSSKELNDVEVMTRQFRSLMNKITEGNMDRIIEMMLALELNREEYYRPILEVIFDKAIQEPNFCHIYAEVCNVLSKSLRINKVDESGEIGKIRFKSFLIEKVQKAFENRLINNQVYIDKEKELEAVNSEVTKKRLKDELDEIIRNLKRKYMGNMKLIGQLFRLEVISHLAVNQCIGSLFDKDEGEWQYESLCNLLNVIGYLIDRDNRSFMDTILSRMKEILPNIADNRIKFMFMNLFDTRANNWQIKKPKEPTVKVDNKSSRHYGYNPRISGYSNQNRHQYIGSSSSASKSQVYEKSQHQLNFDSLDSFDHTLDRNRRSVNLTANRGSDKQQLVEEASRKLSVPNLPKSSVPINTAPSHKSNKVEKAELLKLIKHKPAMKSDEQEASMKSICTGIHDPEKFWEEGLADIYTDALDYEETCLQFGCMMFWAIRNKGMTEKFFIHTTNDVVWQNAESLQCDIPRLFENMGALLSNVFNPKNSAMIRMLSHIFKPIAMTKGVGVLIANMLEIACKSYSNEHVKHQLDHCNLNFHKYCPPEDLQRILKMKTLDKLLPGEIYKKDLYNYLVNNLSSKSKSNKSIISGIVAEFQSSELKVPKIMQPVMTAILNLSVDIGPNNEKRSTNKELINERVNVLSWFIKEEEHEMEAIKTICEFVAAKENPYGLLDELLTIVCCNNLISEKTFFALRRKINTGEASNSIPGTLILAMNKFFKWLEQKASVSDEACQSGDDD